MSNKEEEIEPLTHASLAPLEPVTVDLTEINRFRGAVLEGDIKELYDKIAHLIRQSIGQQKLSSDHLRPVLLTIVEQVQKYSDLSQIKIEGSAKKALALNLTKHVLTDLHAEGQIPTEAYEYAILGLDFMGSALIDGMKALYRQIHGLYKNIKQHGCSDGCAASCNVQ